MRVRPGRSQLRRVPHNRLLAVACLPCLAVGSGSFREEDTVVAFDLVLRILARPEHLGWRYPYPPSSAWAYARGRVSSIRGARLRPKLAQTLETRGPPGLGRWTVELINLRRSSLAGGWRRVIPGRADRQGHARWTPSLQGCRVLRSPPGPPTRAVLRNPDVGRLNSAWRSSPCGCAATTARRPDGKSAGLP